MKIPDQMYWQREQEDFCDDIQSSNDLPPNPLFTSSQTCESHCDQDSKETYLGGTCGRIQVESPVVAGSCWAVGEYGDDRDDSKQTHDAVANVVEHDLRGCLGDAAQECEHGAFREIERHQEQHNTCYARLTDVSILSNSINSAPYLVKARQVVLCQNPCPRLSEAIADRSVDRGDMSKSYECGDCDDHVVAAIRALANPQTKEADADGEDEGQRDDVLDRVYVAVSLRHCWRGGGDR